MGHRHAVWTREEEDEEEEKKKKKEKERFGSWGKREGDRCHESGHGCSHHVRRGASGNMLAVATAAGETRHRTEEVMMTMSSRRTETFTERGSGKINATKCGRRAVAAVASALLRFAVALLCIQVTGTAGVCTDAGSCDTSTTAVCTARTLASGSCLTLATAGARAQFTISARDAENRPVLDSLAYFRVDLLRGGTGQYLAADSTSFSQPCLSSVGFCVSSVVITSAGAGCLEGGMLGATGGGGSGFLAR